MKIVFHIGVHKTASTYLQTVFETNVEQLREDGIYVVAPNLPQIARRQRECLRRLQNPRRPNPDPTALLRMNQRSLRQARLAGAHCIVFSDENYVGWPFPKAVRHGITPARFYPDCIATLKHISVGLEEDEIHVLLYEREPASWLKSMYLEGVAQLQVIEPPETFFRNVVVECIDFAELRARVMQAMPSAKVSVLPFEAIKADPQAFVQSFFTSVGETPRPLVLPSQPVRPAPDADQAAQLLTIAQRLVDAEKPRALKRQAAQIKAAPANPDNRLCLPADVLNRLKRGASPKTAGT